VKERTLVICRPNEKDTGGRARVTSRDDERVLPVD